MPTGCPEYLRRTLSGYVGENVPLSVFDGMNGSQMGLLVARAGNEAGRLPLMTVNGFMVQLQSGDISTPCEALRFIMDNETPVVNESEEECRTALINEHLLPLGLDPKQTDTEDPRRVFLNILLGYMRAERIPADVYNTEGRQLQNVDTLCETLSNVNRVLSMIPPGPYVNTGTTEEQAAEIQSIRFRESLKRFARVGIPAFLAWRFLT